MSTNLEPSTWTLKMWLDFPISQSKSNCILFIFSTTVYWVPVCAWYCREAENIAVNKMDKVPLKSFLGTIAITHNIFQIKCSNSKKLWEKSDQ